MNIKSLSGPLCLFCAFTLAGTSVISARFVSEKLGTFTITTLSLGFALLVLLPLCRNRLLKTLRQMHPDDWLRTVIQALFGIFLFRMLLLSGLLHTSSGEAGILTGATPAFTAIFAWILLKEPLYPKSVIGISLTIGGVLLIQGLLTQGYTLTSAHVWGNVMVLGAAASESTFSIFSRISAVKSVSRQHKMDPLVQTTLVSAIALILCLIPAIYEQPLLKLSAVGIVEWMALAWYGVFVTALAFICWYAGISRCTATTAAAFSGMMPFTSLILSVIILKETAGWHQWLGGLLVISGMILIGLVKHAPRNADKQNKQIMVSNIQKKQ